MFDTEPWANFTVFQQTVFCSCSKVMNHIAVGQMDTVWGMITILKTFGCLLGYRAFDQLHVSASQVPQLSESERNTNWGRSWNLLLYKRAVPCGKPSMLALNPRAMLSLGVPRPWVITHCRYLWSIDQSFGCWHLPGNPIAMLKGGINMWIWINIQNSFGWVGWVGLLLFGLGDVGVAFVLCLFLMIDLWFYKWISTDFRYQNFQCCCSLVYFLWIFFLFVPKFMLE